MERLIALHCTEKQWGEGIKGERPPEHLSCGQEKYCIWLPLLLLPALLMLRSPLGFHS